MEEQDQQDSFVGIYGLSSDSDGILVATRPNEPLLRKQPPLESSHSIHVRSLVILSFWTVVILLGLPTWWWTTSIHRARLPLEEMLEWADGKASRLTKSRKLSSPRIV